MPTNAVEPGNSNLYGMKQHALDRGLFLSRSIRLYPEPVQDELAEVLIAYSAHPLVTRKPSLGFTKQRPSPRRATYKSEILVENIYVLCVELPDTHQLGDQ